MKQAVGVLRATCVELERDFPAARIFFARMRTVTMILCSAAVLAGCATKPQPPDAQRTFATHCASCHGILGEGDGPMVEVMRVNVPNLRHLAERNGGVFPADAIASYIDGRNLPASHGDRVMPVWGDVFDTTSAILDDAEAAQSRIEGVVELIRELQYD